MTQAGQTIRGAGRALFALPARSDALELLDEDQHDPAELAANLRDIRRVNHLLGGTSTTLRHLPDLVAAMPISEPITILDLATGSGDIPIALTPAGMERWRTSWLRPKYMWRLAHRARSDDPPTTSR